MPKCTINGREFEVAPGTTVIQAALANGIDIPHFCWHPDLVVDGNCRMCLVEVEKMPKLQIACNTQVTDGMVITTNSEKASDAHRTTLEFLLVNHPIDCPVCDQAGECYLQDQYMDHGLHESEVEVEEKVHKRKVVDLGPIMLDAERCVLCSRCLRYERDVTATNSFEFKNRGDHMQISTFEERPITHDYAGNLADICPVGALLSHDFRFKMRVWFLKETESICPGCSTGCNMFIDHRDAEAQRFRPRRNPAVNKSWMCDPGRALYKGIGAASRLASAQVRTTAGLQPSSLDTALEQAATQLQAAGKASAFLATPQASNEDLWAFARLAEACGGKLDFRVGDPQDKLEVRLDNILQHADRNPNTRGCLDQGLGRDGVEAIVSACRNGDIRALVLQGPELLRDAAVAEAVARVPFVVVMASHDETALAGASVVLPAAAWAETEGTFTNYQGRVQRFRKAFPPPGDARARWELAAALLSRLGAPLAATSARELFASLAAATPGYAGLDLKSVGSEGAGISGAATGAAR